MAIICAEHCGMCMGGVLGNFFSILMWDTCWGHLLLSNSFWLLNYNKLITCSSWFFFLMAHLSIMYSLCHFLNFSQASVRFYLFWSFADKIILLWKNKKCIKVIKYFIFCYPGYVSVPVLYIKGWHVSVSVIFSCLSFLQPYDQDTQLYLALASYCGLLEKRTIKVLLPLLLWTYSDTESQTHCFCSVLRYGGFSEENVKLDSCRLVGVHSTTNGWS